MRNNSMKLQFLSLPENEPFARGAIAAFALPLNPSLAELSDIKTAVSEAVTNAIVHGYAGTVGEVSIEARLEGDTLSLTVSDGGKGIEDVERAVQPFFTTLADEEHSGMGFTIMQTFMTEFSIESAPGKGTRVTMRKKIGQNAV